MAEIDKDITRSSLEDARRHLQDVINIEPHSSWEYSSKFAAADISEMERPKEPSGTRASEARPER